MSEFWEELKDEVEDAVYQCKFCAKKDVQKRGSYSYFCEKRWLPCAHAIARGQCEMFNNHSDVEDAIFELPSAERKRGKWKLNKDGNWACPFCEFDPYHDNMKGMNYCPNCGAKMDGKETEDATN